MYIQVFISDCIGVKWVGFVHAIYGLIGAIVTFATGKALCYIPQPIVVFFALIFITGMCNGLIYWERMPQAHFIFLLAIGWAIGEAMVMTIAPGTITII